MCQAASASDFRIALGGKWLVCEPSHPDFADYISYHQAVNTFYWNLDSGRTNVQRKRPTPEIQGREERERCLKPGPLIAGH